MTMTRTGRTALFVLLSLTLAGLAGLPVFGAQTIMGSARAITPADNADLGGTFACRNYSVAGADAGINNNTPECQNIRCPRPYNTNTIFGFGGYRCNQENTASYNTDQDNQTVYMLVDAEVGAGACNHIAYFAVQGMIASSTVLINVGDDRQSGCPGTASINCYFPVDPAQARQTPLPSTFPTHGPVPHQITSIAGLSPVPTVRIHSDLVGCGIGAVRLTWEEPETYAGLMRNGVPSPVQGVNLYVNHASCGTCPDGATGWSLLGSFPMSAGATGICQPLFFGGSWYALTVRLKGPGSAPSSIETGMVGGVGFVGANSQCVDPRPVVARIVSLSARYVGRSRVNVQWTSGAEGGVEGFLVSRASSPAGPYDRVSEVIAPTGDGSRYAFSDRVHASAGGGPVYYRIEVACADATAEYSGVVSAILPAPRAKKLDAR
jgi:hypothetical protein